MEHEKQEDLLESSQDEESESDDCLQGNQEKIVELIHRSQLKPKGLILIFSCLFLFLSSSVLLIVAPIYIEHSRRCGISGYSKAVTLTSANAMVFIAVLAVAKAIKRCLPSWRCPVRLHFRLPGALKLSCAASSTLVIFYIDSAQLVSCHLQDPLKGCVVVFSFAFYFIYSKRKMSVERVFCTLTVIVGTFVAVDFGLCDRYRCRGADTSHSAPDPSSFHAIYIIVYILAMAAYALHLTMLENSCRYFNYSSNLDVSIVSSASSKEYSASSMPITQSLSIISGGRSQGPHDLQDLPRDLKGPEVAFGPAPVQVLQAPYRDLAHDLQGGCEQVSFDASPVKQGHNPILHRRGQELTLGPSRDLALTIPHGPSKFPVTSTPNEVKRLAEWDPCDLLAVHHCFTWAFVLLFCWLPTVALINKNPQNLLDVLEDLLASIRSHVTGHECPQLWIPYVTLLLAYLVFIMTSLTVLLQSMSALTVVCVVMNALPMSAIFWSVYQLNASTADLVTFNLNMTGETISAMLGFPIIGIGTFLLLKSHVTNSFVHLRLR